MSTSTTAASSSASSSTNEKIPLALCCLGHVDCGKSSLAGRLLLECGGVDRTLYEKCQKQADEMGRGSFSLAWLVGQLTKNERERGLTLENHSAYFDTPRSRVQIMTTPALRDFMRMTVNAVAASDAALLVVAAGIGEFEAGICQHGMTREHMLLAQCFGIRRFVVPITKMDMRGVDYSEARFNEIRDEVVRFMRKVLPPARNLDLIHFIPVSATENVNCVTRDSGKKMPWYKGPSVVEALDMLCEQAPPRYHDPATAAAPLRFVVEQVFLSSSLSSTEYEKAATATTTTSMTTMIVLGRVESGILRAGDAVLCQPGGVAGRVISIEMEHERIAAAKPGQRVGFKLAVLSSSTTDSAAAAESATRKRHAKLPVSIVGPLRSWSGNDSPRLCKSFVAQMALLSGNTMNRFKPGFIPLFNFGHDSIACKLETITSHMDRSGRVIPPQVAGTTTTTTAAAPTIRAGESIIARFTPSRDFVIEIASNSDRAPLSHFAVIDQRVTIAVGIVKDVQCKRGWSEARLVFLIREKNQRTKLGQAFQIWNVAVSVVQFISF